MSDATTLYTLLKELFLIIEDGDRRFFQEQDLTITRFYALWHLRDKPGQTLRSLADRMLCDKSNVTRVVKGLERDKLIVRENHESDGRAYRLYLTPRGRARVDAVDVMHASFNEQRFEDNVLANDYSALEDVLSRLKNSLVTKLEMPLPNGVS